eukprot:TRINITY_DN32569_c0_g1_i1.p1 TRINITY_DN32569_c0_g1~~TRINITY_DN32569_c0_g1_i1.p1  ORF type:complete len:228 (-),score=26.52 TRINITY_DN32569_c0_g1_i1:496-1179(-)
MASSTDENPSQYVKLRLDNITNQPESEPGELNQPVEVPQLNLPRCFECGQVLPQAFQPPADEPWATGIFSCGQDRASCLLGAFCPCVLFGRNVEESKDIPWTTPCILHGIFVEGGIGLAIATVILQSTLDASTTFCLGEGLVFAWWMCGIHAGLFRQELQKKYHLKNSPCDPCCVHCVFHQCALCQEHREMQMRLREEPVPMTVINPPQEQEMHAGNGMATAAHSES